MTATRRHPFTLADAMFLVAALTPGLVLLRIAVSFDLFTVDPSQKAKAPPGRYFVEHLSVAGGCILLSLSLAVLILTVCRPRPTLREAIGGPGFVACLAIVVGSIFPLARFAVDVLTSDGFAVSFAVAYTNLYGRMVRDAGPMIIGAWLALALVGRWRFQPAWWDRLGCVIGACWILLFGYVQVYFIGLILLQWLAAKGP